MSKFLHPDAMGEPGAPSAAAFDAAARLGIRWPVLPWTCSGCGRIYEDHRDTVATIDLELAVSLAEVLQSMPLILASPRLADMPLTRRAVEAFADYLRSDLSENGPPAVFLCIGCDVGQHMLTAVHVLIGGVTVCGIRDLPAGHKWVRKDEIDLATCLLCKQLFKLSTGG